MMPNPCALCDARCCKEHLITVTSLDVVRIAKATGKKAEEFATLAPAKLLNADESTVLECYLRGERYDYVLALRSHPCIFLGSGSNPRDFRNLCTIHDFAPLVCRCYPLGQDKKTIKTARCSPISGLAFRVLGPVLGSASGSDAAAYSSQLSEYRKLVRKWNEKRGKTGECLDFLLEKSGESV